MIKKQLCVQLVWGSWGLDFLNAVINILLAANLDFRENHTISHYSCAVPSLFLLSCSDVSINLSPAVFQPDAWVWDPPPNHLFLCSYCLHHPEHQLHPRLKEGLLHLLLTCHCGELLLRICFPLLSHTNYRIPSGADLLCAIWCGHSHGESSHLQPEEQEVKGSCEKNTEYVLAMFQIGGKKKARGKWGIRIIWHCESSH